MSDALIDKGGLHIAMTRSGTGLRANNNELLPCAVTNSAGVAANRRAIAGDTCSMGIGVAGRG